MLKGGGEKTPKTSEFGNDDMETTRSAPRS